MMLTADLVLAQANDVLTKAGSYGARVRELQPGSAIPGNLQSHKAATEKQLNSIANLLGRVVVTSDNQFTLGDADNALRTARLELQATPLGQVRARPAGNPPLDPTKQRHPTLPPIPPRGMAVLPQRRRRKRNPESEGLEEAIHHLDGETDAIPPTLRSPHENDRMPVTVRDTPIAKRPPPPPSSERRSTMRPVAPSIFFEGEFEGDPMHGGWNKRARDNRQEKIRVERQRSDRADRRAKAKAALADPRNRAARRALRRRVAPAFAAALVRGVDPAMAARVPGGPQDIARVKGAAIRLATSQFIQDFAQLVGEGKASAPLPTVVNALIASALAAARERFPIFRSEAITPMAAIAFQILSSQLPALAKIALIVLTVATGRGAPPTPPSSPNRELAW